MTIKKAVVLDTTAELFLAAFNGGISGRGKLERVARQEDALDPQPRWFRQTFTGPAAFDLYVGVSNEVSGALAQEPEELLSGVFQTLSRVLGGIAGSGVACGTLNEEIPEPAPETIVFELRRESLSLGRVMLFVPPSAMKLLRPLQAAADAARTSRPPARHMDALMNVDLPVSISLGSTELLLADVLKLTTGSIIELNQLLNEPVNVVVNDCLVARGDVVVVDGNYGIRISEVVSPGAGAPMA